MLDGPAATQRRSPGNPRIHASRREHDVHAFRLEPKIFELPATEDIWGEFRDAASAEKSLLLVSADGFYCNFAELDTFISLFPQNPIILLNSRWRNWRWVMHLMNRHPNLHLEFSAQQANRAIEYVAEHYGAERALFGTGLPQKAPGAARGFFDWTLLDQTAATKVAGGNLARLLGAGPKTIPAPGHWDDALTQAACAGRPLPCPVADDHCHILHDNGSSAGGPLVMHRGDADGMIELIRRVGIDTTAIMSWAGPLSGDPDLGNEIVARAVARYPHEFVGVATVMPEVQGRKEIEEVIQHYHRELKFPGLKPFPRLTMDFDHPAFEPWFQYADAHRLYIVFAPATVGPSGNGIVETLSTRYPNMGIHLDHCGRSWDFAKWAVELMDRFPNVWAQLNFTEVTNGTIEYLAEKVGAHRMLFGTDTPMRAPRPQAGWLVFTRLAEKQKRQIFGENFLGILSRADP